MKSQRKYYRPMLIAITLLLASFAYYNQEGEAFIHNLKLQLKKYSERMPLEKAYLHTDKSFYKPGEIVWFKAYVLNGASHEATLNSEVLYTELINPRGNVENKLTLPIMEGGADGSFDITESMPGGIYKLRAYTNWMKNFGDTNYFEKEIQVQKVIYPRLLMKIDFEKEAYGPADKVDASLSIRTLEDKALVNSPFYFEVSLAGVKKLTQSGTTDKEGKAIVSFILPEDLTSNDGLLNVYIRYEGNTESISRSVPIVLNDIEIQFFPEGGELLKNFDNTCAFIALDEFGKPADIEGIVFDINDNEICTFRSYHQGMGAFQIKPVSGTYYAKITRPKGIKEKYYLPKILKTGYLLNLKNRTDNAVTVRIAAPRNEDIILIGQIRGEMVYSESLNLKEGENEISINTSKYPAGILHLTLFDRYDIPRCERLIFVNPDKQLMISITPIKHEFLPREKVELKVQSFDKDSIPVPAQLSLAVVNDKVLSFADDKQDNILSYLLMSSDLKGKIEEPSFYFDKKEEKADTALDYLLLTHGWRRFTWEEIMSENYSVQYPAEKATSVSGIILDESTKLPLLATVTLLEISGEQRAAQLNTRADGRFLFRNVNPEAVKKLIVRTPGIHPDRVLIQLDKPGFAANEPQITGSVSDKLLPAIIKEKIESVSKPKYEEQDIAQDNFDAVLVPDVQALEEIVVVGYGVQKKSDITGSIMAVESEKLTPLNPELALQGRVAGVDILNYAPGPGEAVNVQIRGINSIASDEPLFIVDGVPMARYHDSKLSPIGHLNTDDIESIYILKDASATAIYGADGASGVIVINTKNEKNNYFQQKVNTARKRYCVADVPVKTFSRVREFYCPSYEKSNNIEERSDFRTTIYWNPDVKTDNTGEATVSFYNSDEITTFRATAEGIGVKGLIGRGESTYFTQLPFSIETKIPPYLTYDDVVEIPILLKNNTDQEITGKLGVLAPDALEIIDEIPSSVTLAANNNYTVMLKCKVLPVQGKFSLHIDFKAKGLKDALDQEIEIQPKGFPVTATVSGNELDKQYIVTVSDPLEGSLKATFSAFPDVTNDLMAGIESILREPYGCFEQTSSSTYPNIMVLQYLEETGTANPQLYKKALDLIDKGYNRLISFETSAKGYEWFGQAPGHESLTAYGLMEFSDMNKVYKKVDANMLERTADWILKRRDGKGNFELNSRALDQFGRASQEVVNAYVVYALSEAGFNDLETEYDVAYQEAMKSQDPYRVCLMAISSYNLGKKVNGNKLLQIIDQKLQKHDFSTLAIDHSITRSGGLSLQVETASLYLMALLKSDQASMSDMNEVSKFIISARCGGGFGSTQGTILALKALTEFAKFSKHTQSSGNIELYVNGELVADRHYEKGDLGEITIDSLQKLMKTGSNIIQVTFTGADNALPYSLDASWTSMTPQSSDECVIDLSTQISSTRAKVGETVRLTATVTNITNDGQPMTIAIIGIPAGLSAQPWQLKELREKNVFDYYEVRKNYVVVYYRDMAPGEKHTIHLDLKAEIPGTYVAPASTGYLYYTNEYKNWEAGSKIQVVMD